jgi:Protein of unknown function DUF262/Protein of unknown function (DUF1524)
MPTEAKDIFEATSRSLRELTTENGLGLYIPPYQRPYGWDKGKVEKLLDDTLHGLAMLMQTEDSFTFLGTIITIHDINYTTVQPIVRDQVPAKVLTVIDGQQRLCTLILLTVCLHNQIRLRMHRLFKEQAPDSTQPALTWIHGQSLESLKNLGATFYERQSYGDAPIYPRMIRAFTDQWSRIAQHAQYKSPIAYLINTYSALTEKETAEQLKATEFRPAARDGMGEGEVDLVRRYGDIRTVLRDLARAKKIEELEDLPTLSEAVSNKDFQRALLNHEFPDDVITALGAPLSDEFAELLRLLIMGAYVLNRVALTVVKGRNEDYAFTIFESLNTTGEPLTAFETFKPRVVSAESLAGYEGSEVRKFVDNIADYLSGFRVGDQLQTATRDLLVTFALAETGVKLSKRLADQRSYLKDEFDRHKTSQAERVKFVRHLRDTAAFTESMWRPRDKMPNLDGLLVDATTDVVRLCSAFFRELNHSVVIAPLVRFYEVALKASAADQHQRIKDFEAAIRAMTAFSVLWRVSRRTTGNIDREYREIMSGVSGLTNLGPLARTRRAGVSDGAVPAVDVVGLKQELIARLAHSDHGGISGLQEWLEQSWLLPIYQTSRPLTRFVLLAAYHDTVVDPAAPGLIMKGKEGSAPCLTYDGWRDEIHLSLEHVAPQGAMSAWPDDLYKDKETVHRLGNLVLLPQDANSSVSERPWPQKRTLYGALGAPSKEEAKEMLEGAAEHGMTFATSTEALVDLSKHMPHLAALSARTGAWDVAFIEARSRRLLELAWARLRLWLQ